MIPASPSGPEFAPSDNSPSSTILANSNTDTGIAPAPPTPYTSSARSEVSTDNKLHRQAALEELNALRKPSMQNLGSLLVSEVARLLLLYALERQTASRAERRVTVLDVAIRRRPYYPPKCKAAAGLPASTAAAGANPLSSIEIIEKTHPQAPGVAVSLADAGQVGGGLWWGCVAVRRWVLVRVVSVAPTTKPGQRQQQNVEQQAAAIIVE
ncbi:hypothetical protein BDZ97DRAFT_1921274 [Flammula alnicola]|nr:hypothetical protein BDZ97DRAFT_1921274 [Flammula alnicola]